MSLSLIIPAHDEAAYLPATLAAVRAAAADAPCEVIVVDNASTDSTRDIAAAHGATVLTESVRNIGRVRNVGARNAMGDVLMFLDADTIVPPTLFVTIAAVMADPRCSGGAVAVDYGPFARKWMKWYLRGWAFWGRLFNMKQGAAQFCRRSAFQQLGGYDETIHVGEDIEFYWRLSRLVRRQGGSLEFIEQACPFIPTQIRQDEPPENVRADAPPRDPLQLETPVGVARLVSAAHPLEASRRRQKP